MDPLLPSLARKRKAAEQEEDPSEENPPRLSIDSAPNWFPPRTSLGDSSPMPSPEDSSPLPSLASPGLPPDSPRLSLPLSKTPPHPCSLATPVPRPAQPAQPFSLPPHP
ncbi:hypothetical protein OF83DRAFT_1177304 [Amylostereum chailletii]|nr:hypothetical protein OF83DRAFT_1177304 [Amylostereum chailletii]